ncbi:hypothetical protein [uncultured Fibrobacter sp.]
MIFGTVDPSIAGYQPAKQSVEMNHSMHDHSHHH